MTPILHPPGASVNPALQEGLFFDDGAKYTRDSYKAMADDFAAKWAAGHPALEREAARLAAEKGLSPSRAGARALEEEFWRVVETNTEEVGLGTLHHVTLFTTLLLCIKTPIYDIQCGPWNTNLTPPGSESATHKSSSGRTCNPSDTPRE
jgi:hypothetical protein